MINTIFDNEDVKNAIDEIVKSKDNFDIEIHLSILFLARPDLKRKYFTRA